MERTYRLCHQRILACIALGRGVGLLVVAFLLAAMAGCDKVLKFGSMANSGEKQNEPAPPPQKRAGKKMPAGVSDAAEQPKSGKPKPVETKPVVSPAVTPDQVMADLQKRQFKIVNDDELKALAESLAGHGDLVTTLDLSGSRVTPAGMLLLENFPKLVELNLARLSLTSNGWEPLAKLASLEKLNLADSNYNDAALASLGGLAQLKDLNLANTEQVTDKGHEALSQLTNLERLDISRNAKIKGAGFVAACKNGGMPRLRELIANASQFGVNGMSGVERLEALEALEVGNSHLQNEGLRAFRKCRDVKRLLIGGNTTIDDVGMQELKHLKQLEYLELRNLPKVSDYGLGYIKGAKQLEFVYVDGTAITANGVRALKKLIPQIKIRFKDEVIE